MANIEDIVQVAEALEKSPVAVVKDRCVAVRNRNATCRQCVQACIADAIDVAANDIRIDGGACVACGACVVACPTEAIVAVSPAEDEIVRAIAQSAAALDGHAVFACARISSKKLADPSLYTEVPCLARVGEDTIVNLAAHGVSRVTLVDGNCATCKYRDGMPAIDASVRFAEEMLKSHGSNAQVERVSAFPENVLVDSADGLFGSTRRGFFSDAVGMAKETAITAASTAISQELGIVDKEAAIGERLRVSENGSMPRLRMKRHEALINALDCLGPAAETLVSRRFGKVDIDLGKCNACGMCVVFCPSGALERDDADSASNPLSHIEFSACECVQCGLCRDVCWKGALTLAQEVPLAQLYDFEPVTFDVRGRAKRNNPFGKF